MNELPIVRIHIVQAIEASGSPVPLAWLMERLASPSVALRVGAVHTLERVAHDAPDAHWPVMEFLCDFLHERATWQGAEAPPALETHAELQAVLDVLGRRARRHEFGKEVRLDLNRLDLRGANLVGAHLERSALNGTHLDGAALGACHLEYATCQQACFDGAWMTGASLLGANLRQASLRGARVARTIFNGATLEDAALAGVDLREARGLTPAQLARARTDAHTRLPETFDTEPGAR
ncbi:MAG TPA: pentapeptide repeat-containing protein [Armatimonadota bacterium]|nr:pentapeptide repeat-containing protein [Armatimonadota bacterium]HOS42105.1 pentapeptide repeat-containing protein [Armatimonadota bacterium]